MFYPMAFNMFACLPSVLHLPVNTAGENHQFLQGLDTAADLYPK